MPAFFCLGSLRSLRPGPMLPGGYLVGGRVNDGEHVEVQELDHPHDQVEAEDPPMETPCRSII